MAVIGIDLGTSAVKLLLVNEAGGILKSVSREYPLLLPHPGWSEQNPEDWWNAVKDGIRELLEGFDAAQIKGIGCAGQMHGLVALDRDGAVIRPAILWNDGRTSEETDWLNETVGREKLTALTANIAFAGFTAPKLLWMRKHEADNYARIDRIMLPKDYINYRLTGAHVCDYSDASGMLLLDVEHKRWSSEMLELCGVPGGWMPELHESWEPIGTLTPAVARELGLPESVKVVAGAGDNAAAAIGTGTVADGACNLSIGTSGTLFIASDRFGVDPNNALHSFAHASGKYHLMGCMLSAASCNKWFCEDILDTTHYDREQAPIGTACLGTNRVFFLPYLMGERSPINDTDARGAFIGLAMTTTRADMVQAVLEGVAFALRDSLEAARRLGLTVRRSKLCGGGARSPLWQKILANILNVALDVPQTEEGPGYGGAALAAVGCGVYGTVAECAGEWTRTKASVEPDPEIASRYEESYQKFRLLYPALKGVFPKLR